MTPEIQRLLTMAACAHEHRAGGNDYLLCNDCGLMWDYRRESADRGLINHFAALLALPADLPPPEAQKEDFTRVDQSPLSGPAGSTAREQPKGSR
jgi:hypothetical protein